MSDRILVGLGDGSWRCRLGPALEVRMHRGRDRVLRICLREWDEAKGRWTGDCKRCLERADLHPLIRTTVFVLDDADQVTDTAAVDMDYGYYRVVSDAVIEVIKWHSVESEQAVLKLTRRGDELEAVAIGKLRGAR